MKTQARIYRAFVRRYLLAIGFLAQALFAPSIRAGTPPAIEWQAVFGGTNYDQIDSIVETADHGALLGGYSYSDASGNKTNGNFDFADYWIVKVDESGNKQWEQEFGGDDDDFLNGMQSTIDGGYMLAGTSYSSMSGNKTNSNLGRADYWLVKVDVNGNKLWERIYGGDGQDWVETLIVAHDGNFIIAGESSSDANGNKTTGRLGGFDYWLVKVDISGNKMWERVYGGLDYDNLYTVIPTSDGGYLLGGESASGIGGNKSTANAGWYDFWLVKLNSDGNKVWEQSYGGTNDDWLVSIAPTSDNGWLLGGTSRSDISGNKTNANYGFADFWIVKVDGSGTKQWERSFGGDDSDFLDSILPTSDGNFLIGGFSYSGVSGNKTSPNRGTDFEDYWVVMIDADGNKLWEQTYGGEDYDDLYVMRRTSDGGYLLGGSSASPLSGNKTVSNFGDGDCWVIKLAPETMPPPRLAIDRSDEDLVVSWPSPSPGFTLEQSHSLYTSNWTGNGQMPNDDGTNKSILVTPGTTNTYFRLSKSE